MTSGYFETGDGKLYYEVAGPEGAATVVLNHAAFLDSGMWDTQWAALTEQYRVIRYDMMGFGKSDPVTRPRCRRADLYALLQHLNVQNAHLVGCSMGGEIVLDLTLEYPELARSLTIVNGTPSGFVPQGEPPQYLFEMFGAMQAQDFERASEFALRIWVDGPQRTPEQVDPAVRQHAAAMNLIPVTQNTFAIADMQPANPLDPPAITRLEQVTAPTLIVKGMLDHAETLRVLDLMAAGIPDARAVEIAQGAHVPNMEQPATFNQAVLAFLADHATD